MGGDTRAIDTTADPTRAAPSRRVRRFVNVYLALFIAFGLVQLELWPLTGFRLYAEIRTEERTSTRVIGRT